MCKEAVCLFKSVVHRNVINIVKKGTACLVIATGCFLIYKPEIKVQQMHSVERIK